MKCPYCGDDMEEGIIRSPQEIALIPGIKERFSVGRSFTRGLWF